MIPLIRPLMPTAAELSPYLDIAREAGMWSNFGPVYAHCIEEIKKWTGGFPVLCSNASNAIGILADMMFESSQTVLVPDYTHAGSILPILAHDHDVWLMGCDPMTRAVDLSTLELAFETDDDGIDSAVIVNPFGRGIDREKYAALARKHGRELIFDYAGAWGDFDIQDEFPTVYSFHATKSIPIGEGAVVVFPSAKEAEVFRKRTNFSTAADRMIQDLWGGNFKLSEVSCAVLAAQLEYSNRVYQRIAHRKQLQRIYSNITGIDENLSPMDTLKMNLSLCTVTLPEGIHVREFERQCEAAGFIARQYYIPLHTMPAFAQLPYEGKKCPALNRCVALPSDATMEEAIDIVDQVQRILGRMLSTTKS